MEERGHILKVLKQVRTSLKTKDYVRIKNLSNKIIHSSSIDQDPDVISVAVIIYALSKIVEREDYKNISGWQKFYPEFIVSLERLIKSLSKNQMEEFRGNLDNIKTIIEKKSGNLKVYLIEVFRKARINKASRIYEHGISMEKTAKILGISIWELAEYAGGTGISDVNLSVTMPIKQRLKIVEEAFS